MHGAWGLGLRALARGPEAWGWGPGAGGPGAWGLGLWAWGFGPGPCGLGLGDRGQQSAPEVPTVAVDTLDKL